MVASEVSGGGEVLGRKNRRTDTSVPGTRDRTSVRLFDQRLLIGRRPSDEHVYLDPSVRGLSVSSVLNGLPFLFTRSPLPLLCPLSSLPLFLFRDLKSRG